MPARSAAASWVHPARIVSQMVSTHLVVILVGRPRFRFGPLFFGFATPPAYSPLDRRGNRRLPLGMADPWQKLFNQSKVPGGVLRTVPPTEILDGASATIALDHRPNWILLYNSGAVELRLFLSAAALTAGVYFPLPSKVPLSLPDVEAVQALVIEAPSGGGDGEVAVMISEGRAAFNANHPQLTVANGFPEFDDADPLIPGVG